MGNRLYADVFPWALMPAMAYLEGTQLTEVLFTNGGFIIITVLFLRNMIEESRKDLETLELIQTKTEKEIFALRCSEFGLTQREIEICELVNEDLIYKDIAESLFISERTVSKHMQNIFKKSQSNNKTELLNSISK
jgi:DNA-binding CsgD family transcriptional regulator